MEQSGLEDIQQKAAKQPGFPGELLQVEKWQNWVPDEGRAMSDRKETERGKLENPLIVTDLTLHLNLTPSPPTQIIVTFA